VLLILPDLIQLHFSFKTVHSVGKDCLRFNRTTARGNILSVFLLQYECEVGQMTEIIVVFILTFIFGTIFGCIYHKFSIQGTTLLRLHWCTL